MQEIAKPAEGMIVADKKRPFIVMRSDLKCGWALTKEEYKDAMERIFSDLGLVRGCPQ